MSVLDELPVALPLGQLPPLRILAMNSRGLQRIDVVAADLEDGVTISTHRKWGWDWSGGQAVAMDPYLENTARFALLGLSSARLPADAPREARDRKEQALVDLAAQVHKQTIWPTRPVDVDGRLFALFVTTTDAGRAAVADLGPVRLAISGPQIPPKLILRTQSVNTLPLHLPSS